MESPSQALARKIVEKLVADGLMTPDDAKKLESKGADGKLRAEDWRLAVEKAMELEAKR
jgi:hypothetical protein